MIIENSYFEDIKRIFKENNHGYITEESNLLGLTDKDMRQYVLREEDMTLGYIILYIRNDFCKKEDYPDKIKRCQRK
ncbi:MAG: hypothetical protein Q4D02_06085 [Clostridia bacterium]|nr:hypothetical protein [Clostridia bacterium]